MLNPSPNPALDSQPLARSRWFDSRHLIGGLMLLSFALGIVSNFALQPLAWGKEGFLPAAAGQGAAIATAVLMDLSLALIGLWISVLLRQRYGSSQPLLTLFCLALSAAELSLCLVEGSAMMTMRSLSASYLAHPQLAEAYTPVAELLKGLRNGLHYSGKAFGGLGLLLFLVLLARAAALPRMLLGLMLAATLLQIVTVAQGFVGQEANLLMLAPLGLLYPVAAAWLLWRGLPR